MKDSLLSKLHDKLCLTACLYKIKVLIGKHFPCYIKENLGTHLIHFSQVGSFMQKQSFVLLCKSDDWFLYECNTGLKWVKGTPMHMWKLGYTDGHR